MNQPGADEAEGIDAPYVERLCSPREVAIRVREVFSSGDIVDLVVNYARRRVAITIEGVDGEVHLWDVWDRRTIARIPEGHDNPGGNLVCALAVCPAPSLSPPGA